MSIASQLSFSTATSVLAGTAGALLYQSAANTTAFLTIGTNGYVLTSNGSVPGWSLASGITSGASTQVQTVLQTASAAYYPAFVNANNASATAMSVYTTSTFTINPSTGVVGIGGSDSGSPLTVKALSTLTGAINSFQKIVTTQANGGNSNNVYRSEWRRRRAAGTDWTTQNIHDGIWVDASFTTPMTDTRAWWDRDPNTASQAWGDQATTWMFVNGTGLGIGTTSPNQKLTVQSDMSLYTTNDTAGTTSMLLGSSASMPQGIAMVKATKTAAGAGYLTLHTASGGTLNEVLRVTALGGFSFGASGSAVGTSGFILKSNGDAAPTWVNPNTVASASATNADNLATIIATANATYYPSFVDSNNATSAYELHYTTSSFNINPGLGYVNIGNSGQAAKLYVELTGQASMAAFATTATTNFAASARMGFSGLANNNDGVYFGMGANGTGIPAGFGFFREATGWNTALAFYTNNVTSGPWSTAAMQEKMRIDSAGNVGIATAAPGAKLHVVGTESRFGGVASGYISVYNASTRSGYIQANAGTDLRVAADTDPMTFYVNGSERARIDTWGNALVGKVTPYNTTTDVLTVLRVQNATSQIFVDNQSTGTSAAAAIVLSAYGGGTTLSVPSSWPVTGLNPFVVSVNATERLRITSTGGIAFSGSTNYGNSGDILKSNGNAAPTWVSPTTIASASATNADNIKTIIQTANASYYPTFVDSNNATAAYEAVYTTSSFVINALTGHLSLGPITSYGGRVTVVPSASTGNPTTASASSNQISIAEVSNNTAYSLKIGYINYSGGYYGSLQSIAGGAANPLLLNADGGNVGIGTYAPAYKLEVNGSFAATTKSFVINHPTKPGMKLRYGSLEGPENGVYVRGKLTGSNKIELPEYWTKLVDPDSITVSLTSIGKHQDLYVADIDNNVVTVGNGNLLSKAINCFYVVYGERCDVDKLVVEI